jgi:hypothetical protein
MAQVKIGASFFKKAKQDYLRWPEAWVREAFQNACDSGANEIEFSFIKTSDNEIHAKIYDNGCGMTEDTLVNKLLSLGESGKNFEGSVGGFGKAKEILFFAQNSYIISTSHAFNDTLIVTGAGGDYEISSVSNDNGVTGTKIDVMLDVEKHYTLNKFIDVAKTTIMRSGFVGKATVNGEVITGRTTATEEIREFSFGKLFKANRPADLYIGGILIRVKGSPMFTYCVSNLEYDVVLELNEGNSNTLTSNRDQLASTISTEFSTFVERLTIDKASALLKQAKKMTLFIGKKNKPKKQNQNTSSNQQINSGSFVSNAASVQLEPIEINGNTINPVEKPKFDVKENEKQEVDMVFGETEETYLQYVSIIEKIPARWNVTSDSKNVKWLLEAWEIAVNECCKLCNQTGTNFITGFVFDEKTEALYSSQENGGMVAFLINPVETGFTMKFRKTKEGCAALLALAAHEVIHINQYYHDEYFSSAYTKLMKSVISSSGSICQKMLGKRNAEKVEFGV